MRNANKSNFPSPVPDRDRWQSAHWRHIGAGDVVCVTRGQEVEATGVIDTMTPDMSVFWILESTTGERRILLPHDGIDVWLARSPNTPA